MADRGVQAKATEHKECTENGARDSCWNPGCGAKGCSGGAQGKRQSARVRRANVRHGSQHKAERGLAGEAGSQQNKLPPCGEEEKDCENRQVGGVPIQATVLALRMPFKPA
jgi:hypothetical protein